MARNLPCITLIHARLKNLRHTEARLFTVAVTLCLSLAAVSESHAVDAETVRTDASAPSAIGVDLQQLGRTAAAIDQDPKPWQSALDRLRQDADESLAKGPFSVTHKSQTPPSGDKRDYMSRGPYWWPDPQASKGLPYIKRDGQINPEFYAISDRQEMDSLASDVETLALGYFFFNDERYAKHAARLLKVWFLDEATAMRPHLEFGQGIPGRSTGRGIGIIETRSLVNIVSASNLLQSSHSWKAADDEKLRQWFAEYLKWLTTSRYGKAESREKNNHGSYYDLQVAQFAIDTGDDPVAASVLAAVPQRIIDRHIVAGGRQPHETSRTRSWDYSVMNLLGMMWLAQLGESQGLDHWRHEGPEGQSIRAALDYLIPYANSPDDWPHKQITPWQTEGIGEAALWASLAYDDPELAEAGRRLLSGSHRAFLILGVSPASID